MSGRETGTAQLAGEPLLEARDLVVVRGRRRVLEIDKFVLRAGESVAVVGPNGAGKSTLLLTLASLIRPEQGTLAVRGTPVPPDRALDYRRRIGLVLPDPLLLDASVFTNVAAGLRFRRMRRAAIRPKVEQWLERLGIPHLRDRPARQVSSGEAQRVALARALVLEPEILLLDEPFAAVDVAARAQLVNDTEDLLRETSLACVLVTHDLDEAERLGSRLTVIIEGRTRQEGTPKHVFAAPVDAEVAAFVGAETRLAGRVVSSCDGVVLVDVGGRKIDAVSDLAPGHPVLCCLRPEDVTLTTVRRGDAIEARSSARNLLGGRITRLVTQGPLVRVSVDCGGPTLVASVTKISADELGIREGDQVEAAFKATAVHLIPLPT